MARGSRLDSGKLRIQINSDEAKKFRFALPSAVAGVRGTEFFMAATSERELVCVLDGIVQVEEKQTNKVSSLQKNQGWIKESHQAAQTTMTSDEQRDKWVKATDIP